MLPTPACPDLFDHENAAKAIWRSIDTAKAGVNVALIGGWGRGKTDVLARVNNLATLNELPVVQVSPWESGHMDVLTGFTSALASKIDNSKEDARLRALLKISGKLGAILCNRLVSAGSGFDLDFYGTGKELVDAFGEGDPRSSQYLSPTEHASNSIKELCRLAYKDSKKILVIIDDIDRCPASWQRAIIESLHFLSHSGVPCTFLCALESRSVLRGSIDDPFNELSSLVAKVFDFVHELHPVKGGIQTIIEHMISKHDQSLDDSIINQLRAAFGESSEVKCRADLLSQGIVLAPELATPRVAFGTLARLRAVCLSGETCSGMSLSNVHLARAFGFSFALRERFPDITEYLFEDFVAHLDEYTKHGSGVKNKFLHAELSASLDALSSLQSKTIWHVLHTQFTLTRARPDVNDNNLQDFVSGIYAAKRLSRSALV